MHRLAALQPRSVRGKWPDTERTDWSPALRADCPEAWLALIALVLASGPLVKPLWGMPDGQVLIEAYWAGLALVGLAVLCARFGLSWVRWCVQQFPVLLLLLAWTLLSCAWSLEPWVSLRLALWLIATTIVGLFVGLTLPPRTLMKVFLWLFAIMIVGSLATAVLWPDYAWEGARRLGYESIRPLSGLTPHHNDLGPLMAFSAVFFLIALLNRKLGLGISLSLLLASLLVLAMARSATAMIMVVFAFVFVIVMFLAKMSRFPSLVAGMMLFFVCLCIAGYSIYALDAATALVERDATLTRRTDIWADALAVIHEQPWLGHGYEMAWAGLSANWFPYLKATSWAGHAHNGFLHLATSLGVPAVLIAGFELIRIALRSFVAFVETSSSFALFSVSFAFGFILLNITESRLYQAGRVDWVLFVAIAVAFWSAFHAPLYGRR